MAKGVIYILTNPSFPDYVKIGYANDLERRLRQLNRAETIPFAFRAYAVYEVDKELTDKERDVIGMHLGFCHNCFHIEEAKTYDEIADLYQFGTEDGVRRFYQRTLNKLSTLLNEKGLFVRFAS